MSKIQKVLRSSWSLVLLLLAMIGLAGTAPQMRAQSNDGTIPNRTVYLPLISRAGGGNTQTTPTAMPTATPTMPGPNAKCQNPATVYGFGTTDRWVREDVGCGWRLLPGDPITITVPTKHFLTTFFGMAYRFCQGVTITVTEGTLWQMGSHEPVCVSDSTPTPMPTNTLVPTNTPTMTPSPTATSTTMPSPTATQPAQWKWQDSITVDKLYDPNVVACGGVEVNCAKWNMYEQGPAMPIRATSHCNTQGAYIDSQGVERYGLQAGVTYEKLTGFTVRPCQ